MDRFSLGRLVAKLAAFGDSFVWGSEIDDNRSGEKSWTGVCADRLGWQYQNCAVPGCGNDVISQQVFDYFYVNDTKNTLVVINWTWSLRFDFSVKDTGIWKTLGPTCVPQRFAGLLSNEQAETVIEFYQEYLNQSVAWHKWRSMKNIYAVTMFLKEKNIPNVQTYMDYALFDTDEQTRSYLSFLQQSMLSEMRSWDGMNFLDWSLSRGFVVTNPGLHPLEQAHQAAADYWQDTYKRLI